MKRTNLEASADSRNDTATQVNPSVVNNGGSDGTLSSSQNHESGNGSLLPFHRHLPRAAHVVTSIACAIGSLLVPHFLQHKHSPELAPEANQLSNRARYEESADGQADVANNQNELKTQVKSLLPVVAPVVPKGNPPSLLSDLQISAQYSRKPADESLTASALAPSVLPDPPGVPRSAALSETSSNRQGSASFAVGNRLSSDAKIFAGSSVEKTKSANLQSAEVTVDKTNRRISIGKTVIKCSTDSKVYLSNGGAICLLHGDTLVDAKNPLLVKVGSDFVLVRKDATALISVRDGALKVRNLQEQHAFSTELAINNRPFNICAGEEIVAANDFDSLQTTLSNDGVTRRQIQTYELSDGTNVMRGEFAPITVIKHSEMLKAMSKSSDQIDSKLFNKMMKMAACLAVVTGGHGSYASVSAEPGNQQMAFSR